MEVTSNAVNISLDAHQNGVKKSQIEVQKMHRAKLQLSVDNLKRLVEVSIIFFFWLFFREK